MKDRHKHSTKINNFPISYLLIGSFIGLILVLAAITLAASAYRTLPWCIAIYVLAYIGLIYIIISVIAIYHRLKKSVHQIVVTDMRLTDDRGLYLIKVKILSFLSIVTNLAYAIFCLVLLVKSNDYWYGILFALYILLPILKGLVLYLSAASKKENNPLQTQIDYEKIMIGLGSALLVVDLILIYPLCRMLINKSPLSYPLILIYVSSGYALTRIIVTMASYFKAQRSHDPTALSLRSLSYVSMLTCVFNLLLGLGFVFFADKARLNYTIVGSLMFASILIISLNLIIQGSLKKKKTSKLMEEKIKIPDQKAEKKEDKGLQDAAYTETDRQEKTGSI